MKKLLYISFITLIFAGCDDRLGELNTDKRNPGKVDPMTLFTQGLRETFDMMSSIDVNENPFRLYAQHWAQTAYPDESQYNLASRNIPANFWENGYRDALADLMNARVLIEEELETNDEVITGVSNATLRNRIAAIDIMNVYVYHVLVDVFGNVPYQDALNPDNLSPKYDDARTIYNSILTKLDDATSSVDASAAGFPADQDPLYEGEMSDWVTFANSLKLRLGMRLADVDKTASISIVNAALTKGVFSSNADNASLTYYGAAPNTNPVYAGLVLSGRQDFVAANTVIDLMNELEDPRRQVYFRGNLDDGKYDGGIYGDANNYTGFSQVGDILHTPGFSGTILNYAEVEFLLAEAVERGGYNVSGSAEEHYNAGIKASFNQWLSYAGVDIETAYEDYIALEEVSYATASGDWKQKIGAQMWLALYNQGFEAWTTWRRLDFERFTPPPGKSAGDIPLRFFYPLKEAQLNGVEHGKAASSIGGDLVSTPIFWDTK